MDGAGGAGAFDLLSDAQVSVTCAHPDFLAATRALAADHLAAYEAEDAATHWLFKDLGRSALYLAAIILDGWPAGLTVAGLIASAKASGAASRGRVLAFAQFARDAGRIIVPPGAEPWIHRRLTVTPAFIEPVRRRFQDLYRATACLAPEVEPMIGLLETDAGVRLAVSVVGLLLASRPELSHNFNEPMRRIFIARDVGMRLLEHFVASQPPGGARLLEAAAFSRADLARRYGVSRAHLNKLIADAAAAGVLRLAARDLVVFTPAFSEELERYFAGQMQVARLVARSLPGL